MDEKQLIFRAKCGDEGALDILYDKYKTRVKNIAKKYFVSDGSNEDLVQEGMLGFVKAINTYDENKGQFYPYLKLLVEQQILNAIKRSNALKNLPLNKSFHLNSQGEVEIEAEGKVIGVPSDVLSPELSVMDEENRKALEENINKFLSPFEKQVLQLYLSGLKYNDIIDKLNVTYKSVDNALNRIKNKLQKLLKGD